MYYIQIFEWDFMAFDDEGVVKVQQLKEPSAQMKVVLAILSAGGAVGYTIATAVLGAVILPVIGYGATATAAGSLATVAQTTAVGAAVFIAPCFLLLEIIKACIAKKEDRDAFESDAAKFLMFSPYIAVACGSALLGSDASPVLKCMLAGQITLMVALLALALIGGGIYRIVASMRPSSTDDAVGTLSSNPYSSFRPATAAAQPQQTDVLGNRSAVVPL